jgi:hypothetical protein
MVRVYYYETGSQQRLPLYAYDGGTFEEADALLHQKRGHRLDIKKGHYQLVTLDKIKEMKERIAGHSDQWYIIFDCEV